MDNFTGYGADALHILETIPCAYLFLDLNSNIRDANGRAKAMFGSCGAGPVGRNIGDLLPGVHAGLESAAHDRASVSLHIRSPFSESVLELEAHPHPGDGLDVFITERRFAGEEKTGNVLLEKTLRTMAHDFINKPLRDLDDAIESALRLVGEYCNVDRTCLWWCDYEKETMKRLYMWVNPGVQCQGGRGGVVPFSAVAEAVSRL